MTLTAPQKRHLAEMVGPTGHTLYWRPSGSAERRCAEALSRKGLLGGSAVSRTDRYYLTDEGLRVAKELTEREAGGGDV